jgi:hypothetical protein
MKPQWDEVGWTIALILAIFVVLVLADLLGF